jgi:hypothetical protein
MNNEAFMVLNLNPKVKIKDQAFGRLVHLSLKPYGSYTWCLSTS